MKTSDIFRKYHIRPVKRLGQNFLIDNNIRDKLCNALNLSSSDSVLEIGAGGGALTESLLKKCKCVWAVECDRNLCKILEEELGLTYPSLNIIQDNILNVDIKKVTKGKKVKVIGNLPYYITSKILFHLIANRSSISSAILTMQKEVANRMCAIPGNKDYGRLTVVLRLFAEIEKLFEINPHSFLPAPKVDSTVIKMTFRKRKLTVREESLFLDVARAVFQERRKTVHNSLCLFKSKEITKPEAKEILDKCSIDPNARPEELMMKDFISLTKLIAKM